MGSRVTSNFKVLESGSREIITVDFPECDFSEKKTKNTPKIVRKIPSKNRETPYGP
jgi:hypothetical protein